MKKYLFILFISLSLPMISPAQNTNITAKEANKKGNEYYNNKDYTEAVKWYRIAAEQGYATGQNNLGYMYSNGYGVTQDKAEAVKWYRKAAEQGYAGGQINLGMMYEKGYGVTQDKAEAVIWYRKAAEQGYANAQYNLGYMYSNGDGVTQDKAEAVKWYRKAAEQGHAGGQVNLGYMYENGYGVTKDYAEAAKWYQKAADQGYISAMNFIGILYERGYGVPQNYQTAKEWYQKALNKDPNFTLAKNNLAKIEKIIAEQANNNNYYAQNTTTTTLPKIEPKPTVQSIPQKMGRVKNVEQTYMIEINNDLTFEAARKKAKESACNQAIVDAFGQIASITYQDNIRQETSIPKGVWIADTKEPKFKMMDVDGRRWIETTVYGKIREIIYDEESSQTTVSNSTFVNNQAINSTKNNNSPKQQIVSTTTTQSQVEPQPKVEPKIAPKPKVEPKPQAESQPKVEQKTVEKTVSSPTPSKVTITNVDKDIPVSGLTDKNTFVVVIGNEKYEEEADVPFAENDAKIFAEYCRKTLGISDKHIRSYVNAGYNDIRKAVSWLKQGLSAYEGDGRVIFYYAGHGIPNETDKSAYLLPVDGIGSDIESAYSLSKLYQSLSELPAKSVLVFLDACFSGAKREGGMMASARGVAIKVRPDEAKGKMVVFTAAQGDETAYPFKSQQHGMFTYYLLKILSETKGQVTLGELGDYLRREVKRESFDENNKIQTPSVNASSSLANSWRSIKLR